jgi:hypothetical protein
MTHMRRSATIRRLVAVAIIAGAGLGLGACEQMADLIPDSKKPLPGERKLLFPEGVPGVTQGVPAELVRGNSQAGQPGAGPQTQQSAPQQAEEQPKPKPKPKAQRTVKKQPPRQEQDEPAPQQQQQTSPWPAPQQQPQASPWPAAPAPGTFTR